MFLPLSAPICFQFRYLPIGFGGHETRNGLPHTSYIAAAQKQLEILETCPTGKSGRCALAFEIATVGACFVL